MNSRRSIRSPHRPNEPQGRQVNAEGLGILQIDEEFDRTCGDLDGLIGRLGALDEINSPCWPYLCKPLPAGVA
jgi:hypothetical protein